MLRSSLLKQGMFVLAVFVTPVFCLLGDAKGEISDPDMSRILQHSVVLIKSKVPGGISRGSGFVTMINGAPYVVTNQHVIAGTQKLLIQNVAGKRFKSNKTWAVSPSQDLAILGIKLDEAELGKLPVEVSRKPPDIGSPLIVLGDNGGADVVTASEGKTKGIGGKKIEFTAEVVPGCSGGPILVGEDSRKVCAVVVSMLPPDTSWMAEDTRFAEARRFGERMPRDDEWEKVDWSSYHRQARTLMDFRQFVIDCGKTLSYFQEDLNIAHEIDIDKYSSAKLGRRVLDFYRAVKEAYDATVHEYKPNALFPLRKAFVDLERDFESAAETLGGTRWKTQYLHEEAKKIHSLLHIAERERARWEMKVTNVIKEVKAEITTHKKRNRREVEVIMCTNPLCEHFNTRAPKPNYHKRRSGRCPQCGERASIYYYWK